MAAVAQKRPPHLTAAAWQHKLDQQAGIRNPAEIRASIERRERELFTKKRQLAARKSVLEYTRCTMPDTDFPADWTKTEYDAQRHHEAIAAALDEFEKDDGEIQFLILTAPPRHGKSELCSRRLPAYASGRNPKRNVIMATYNDEFAMDFGADVRAIMQGERHKVIFPEHHLRRGGVAKDRLQTTSGGLLAFVGRGGSITGRGGDLIILDDLFKDAEEARSQTIRDSVWNWFTKVIMTRMASKKAKVLIIMTRWHEDDLVGRITDPENPHFSLPIAAKFKIIDLPAFANDNDPLGREVGEPLWPDKFDAEFLEMQRSLDPLGFNALYQQSPTPEDGIMFLRQNLKIDENRPDEKELRIYAASDHAVGLKARNSETCLLIVGVDKFHHIWLLDCYWRRASTEIVVEQMIFMMKRWKPLIWWAEKGHISASIGPFLRKRMLESGVFQRIEEVVADEDKERRAQAISGRIDMGYVHFPKSASWCGRAIDQMLKFPNGRLMDFVDAIAHIGRGLDRMLGAPNAVRPDNRPAEGTFGYLKQAAADQQREKQKLAAGWG